MKSSMRAPTILAGLVLSCGSGCNGEDPAYQGELASTALSADSDGGVAPASLARDAGGPTSVSKLDVLFVIDNSGSMASKQARLMSEVSRMISVFTSGDRYAGRPVAAGLDEKGRRFTPVSSLHLGVVSSNVGGLDNPGTGQVALASCAGTGDDGKLQRSTAIAEHGVTAERNEFANVEESAVVIAADPSCALPPQPAFQSFVTSDDPTTLSHDLLCVSRLGVRGCPFEQPLESMWKALAPSRGASAAGPLYTFLNGTRGQGDRENQGFLREDAVLSVVILTDEDDCSITEQGKGLLVVNGTAAQEADVKYGPINLRCGTATHEASLVQPIERFVEGLRQLKPGHPERVVITELVGVPPSAIDAGLSYSDILALPEMQFREDPALPGLPVPACSSGADPQHQEVSYPGRRYLELAEKLAPQVVVESICADSYEGAVNRMVDKVAPMIGRQEGQATDRVTP
ncbi:MAG: hypothetical protein JWN48_1783 [Myxococcaceae bacterium]|nr:hypothetical protein [Myxococcaceae bacterium]